MGDLKTKFTQMLASARQSALYKLYGGTETSDRNHEKSVLRLALEAELASIAEAFAKDNIDFLVLKGPALAYGIYPDPAKREYFDLDILVEQTSVKKALQILGDCGYKPSRSLKKRQFAAEQRNQHALEMLCSDRGVHLDLHWSLMQRQHAVELPLRKLWSRSIYFTLGNSRYRTLSFEDHFLFLSIHGSKVFWQRWRCLLDAAVFIVFCNDIDWSLAAARAKALGVSTMVCVYVELCRSVFDIELPQELSQLCFENPASGDIAKRLLAGLEEGRQLSELEQLRLDLEVRPQISAKLRYLGGRLFIPHEEDWDLNLPDSLFFLHYPAKTIKTIYRGVYSLLR